MLAPGQPVPWFHAAALSGNPRYAIDTAAGRWAVMLFLGDGAHPNGASALRLLAANRALFDDHNACFFGVSTCPDDVAERRIAQALPGVRWFLDHDYAVSKACDATGAKGGAATYEPHWLLLDPMLRVRSRAALADGEQIMAELRALLAGPPGLPTAPVLVVPGVFPPALCRHLIGLYEADGGTASGFMRDVDGVTTTVHDPRHKRRADFILRDQQLIDGLKARLLVALFPIIQRAFQFEVTRVERSIVCCYDAEEGGHFRPHRDNTTVGTAHRRFACTLNLNAEEYDGGDLRFPEFGPQTYRAPTGGAVVFSCSLLHEARPVTRGRRYAFLPFLYDEEAARLRDRNLAQVSPELQTYRSGLASEPVAAVG